MPTRDHIGFTERNLTFYFCHHYLKLREDNIKNIIVWQEMPLIDCPREHIDSIIIDKDMEKKEISIFYIEAKRVYDKSFIDNGKSSLDNDHKRIMDIKKFKKIPGYGEIDKDKEFTKIHYEVLLAGFELRNNQRSSTVDGRLEKLENFGSDNTFTSKSLRTTKVCQKARN